MKPNTKSISLQSLLGRRLQLTVLGFATASILLLLGIQLIWINHEKERLEEQLLEAVGYSLSTPIRNSDLVDIKRTLSAFVIASPEVDICVDMPNGTRVTQGNCNSSDMRTRIVEIPFSDKMFRVYIRVNSTHYTSYVTAGGISGLILLIVFFSTRVSTISKMLLKDLAKIGRVGVSGFSFSEIEVVSTRVKDDADLRAQLSSLRGRLLVKDHFAKIATQVAHDIRSPLGALSMLLQFTDRLPDEQRALAINATTRINEIANDLLVRAKSKTETDNNDNLIERLELNNIAREIVTEKQVTLPSKISLNYHVARGPVYSTGNKKEILRVLSNLINNAIESIKESGSVVVTVGSISAHFNVIEISDTGSGIPSALISKLGTEGFSLGKKEGGSGSGLGLYHAFQIVRALGGDITIESLEGSGTTIKVTLPAAEISPQRPILGTPP